MIFKGEPNMFLMISTKRIKKRLKCRGITFDGNGFYETDKPDLIRILSERYEVVNEVAEAPTIDLNPVVIVEPTEEIEPVKTIMKKCKKCDFECENQGDLMAHYKKEHPKNKGGK